MSHVTAHEQLSNAELLARAEGAAAVVLITVAADHTVRTISHGLAEQDVPRLLAHLAEQYSKPVP